jgi:hypothetical protein
MDYSMKNTNRHKLMAMGLPFKAAKGGMACAPMKKANGGSATADRQGRALLPGKLKKNLPMIAPQKAYAKGGSVKATAYDKMQDQAMQRHENEPMGKAHARKKAKGGIMEKSSGEKYASKAAMKKHEAKESPAMEKAESKKRGGSMTRRSFSR